MSDAFEQGLRIRHARPGDLEACFEIETVCFEGAGATRTRIGRRIHKYPEGFLVAELCGAVVGFVNSGAFDTEDIGDESLKDLVGHKPAGKHLVIFSLVVHPRAQKRGIARELLERIVEQAIADERASVLLDCREHLIRYYESFGFVYHAISPAKFGGHKWHEMRLELQGRLR
jgi:ribosomal protein S18 acetylase RimI-like enzyme